MTFFAVALLQRGSQLPAAEVERLRQPDPGTRAGRLFGIEAWVMLPAHLHCVWQLREGDAEYATRWRLIKARFSHGGGGGDAAPEPCGAGRARRVAAAVLGASHTRRG